MSVKLLVKKVDSGRSVDDGIFVATRPTREPAPNGAFAVSHDDEPVCQSDEGAVVDR